MKYKDFLLIIAPPDRVLNQIKLLKKACAKHIGMFESMHSKGHISIGLYGDEIQTPRQKVFIIERFLNFVERDISQVEPIELKIKGFGYFKHGKDSRTIYAAIELNEETMAWFDHLKTILKIKGKITPHITIAKSITADLFAKLWPYFEKIDLNYSFIPEYITILTREGGSKYTLHKKLQFAKRPGAA